MKVTELSVENFKRITAVAVKLHPHVTEISGENGAGKSSYIDALWVLLKGKKVAPAEPIRKGAERCRIRGKIGEYQVTRIFRRTRSGEVTTELRIERDDEAIPPTEAFMRSLIGEHMLDPGDFISLGSAEKFDVFRSFVPEVDFKAIAAQNLRDYQRRTDINRLAKESRAAAHVIEVPDGALVTAQVDVGELVSQLQRAGTDNADIERRRGNREKVSAQIATLRSEHGSAKDRFNAFAEQHYAACNARVDELLAEMERLKTAIEKTKLDTEAVVLERSRQIAVDAVNALDQATALQAKLDDAGPLPAPIDTQALMQTIHEAEHANENVAKLLARNKHIAAAEGYEAEAEQLTDAMNARERAKQEAIAASKIPIPGITFGDGEVLLDGVPFEQASTAQKFRVGVAIAVAKNPTLRLVWVRDGSLLDDKSYQLIADLAAEFDCQILLETVRAIGKDAIVLEDGHVKEAKQAFEQKRIAAGVA